VGSLENRLSRLENRALRLASETEEDEKLRRQSVPSLL